jgi:hypothetical protein
VGVPETVAARVDGDLPRSGSVGRRVGHSTTLCPAADEAVVVSSG